MKKKLLLILVILISVAFSLAATSYPSLDVQYEVGNEDEIAINQEELISFIQQWQDDALFTFKDAEKELRNILVENNLDLEQLQSLYRIQQQQMQYQEREQGFKIGLTSQPLYSISRSISQSVPSSFDLSNTFSIGAKLSKKLNTGGVATLSASQSLSLTKNSSSPSTWTWSQRPSASLTINQPLGVGEGLIDSDYFDKQLEKLEISNENAKLSYDQLLESLVKQGTSQLSALQSLKESRFLLGEQLLVEKSLIEDAKNDLEEGRISQNAYEARILNLNKIRYSLSEIERQIESLDNSIKIFWGSVNYPNQIIVDTKFYESLPEIIFNKEELVKILLENDKTYTQAMNKLRSAEIDKKLKNPSDAPLLSLSFQISPSYTPTPGADLISSFDDLFTTGSPLFSLSIGFNALDLSRSTTDLSTSLATESYLQAKIEVEKARDAIEKRVDDIQRNINGLLINLPIALYDYEQKANAIEVEQIRFEIGRASESSIKIKKNAFYDSAFTVLQILRELELIALDLESSGVVF